MSGFRFSAAFFSIATALNITHKNSMEFHMRGGGGRGGACSQPRDIFRSMSPPFVRSISATIRPTLKYADNYVRTITVSYLRLRALVEGGASLPCLTVTAENTCRVLHWDLLLWAQDPVVLLNIFCPVFYRSLRTFWSSCSIACLLRHWPAYST